jgi:hypothetical protein
MFKKLCFVDYVFVFLGWSGTESSITEATICPIVPTVDDVMMKMMMMEHSAECLARETEVLRENLPRGCFVHQKSQMTWPGSNPGHHGGKLAINCLSYSMAWQIK